MFKRLKKEFQFLDFAFVVTFFAVLEMLKKSAGLYEGRRW